MLVNYFDKYEIVNTCTSIVKEITSSNEPYFSNSSLQTEEETLKDYVSTTKTKGLSVLHLSLCYLIAMLFIVFMRIYTFKYLLVQSLLDGRDLK